MDREWLTRWQQQQDEQEREEVNQHRRAAAENGKEEFDFDKLCQLYDVSGPMAYKLHDPDGTARWLEYKYYVLYRDVMTLADFAEALEMEDVFR